jgi:hypothetical protein
VIGAVFSWIEEESSEFCTNLQEVLEEKEASSKLLTQNIQAIENTVQQFMKV